MLTPKYEKTDIAVTNVQLYALIPRSPTLRKVIMTPAVNKGCLFNTEPRSPSDKAANTGTSKNGAEAKKEMPSLIGQF